MTTISAWMVPFSALWHGVTRFSFLSAIVSGILSCTTLQAQIVYTPAHEDVERMVRSALVYLESKPQGNSGEATLAGLTFVEALKRYERIIPREHPIVQNAVAHILEDIQNFKEGKESGLKAEGIYYTALAIILLLDVGDDVYKNEINFLVDHLFSHRISTGAFGYSREGNGDSSQSQYAALAFTVLKLHGYKVYTDESSQLLEWFCRTISGEGSWFYHYKGMSPAFGDINRNHSNSLHAAGSSSVYLLADLLNLNPRKPNQSGKNESELNGGLPPSVSIYVPPKSEDDPRFKDGPLVNFDAGLLNTTKGSANRWLGSNFRFGSDQVWNYYFMYGLERYAYFREKAEGRVAEVPNWYDQGVEFLKAEQDATGAWIPPAGGSYNTNNSTCFAILFLVRASELLMDDANTGQVAGNRGFEENKKIDNQNGVVSSQEMVKGVEDIMTLLKNAKSEDDIDMLMDSIGPAIKEFTNDKSKSRAEQAAFLRGLVTDESYLRRKIGIRFVAASQDLDNVPALLYALSDPALDICLAAHNGLRLISRKIDAFPISEEPTAAEFLDLKRKWTEWYKGIRPDVKLLDE